MSGTPLPDSMRHYKKGRELYNRDRYEEALAAFTQATEIEPENIRFRRWKGHALLHTRMHHEAIDAAIREWEAALAPIFRLGRAWNSRNEEPRVRHVEILKTLFNIVEFHPCCVWQRLCEAMGAYELGRLEGTHSALGYYTGITEKFPHHALAWHGRGMVLARLKRREEALAAFIRVVELAPDSSAAWHNLGTALGGLRRWVEAARSYGQAVEFDPCNILALQGKAEALFRNGRRDEATASLAEAEALCQQIRESKNYAICGKLRERCGAECAAKKPALDVFIGPHCRFATTPAYTWMAPYARQGTTQV